MTLPYLSQRKLPLPSNDALNLTDLPTSPNCFLGFTINSGLFSSVADLGVTAEVSTSSVLRKMSKTIDTNF